MSKKKYSNAGKGDKSRVSNKKKFDENWDKIFSRKKDFVEKQQDLTELNADGNRDRGRYGEDLSQKSSKKRS